MSDAVKSMFSDIAQRYDRANSVLSFGIHHLWRALAVRESKAAEGMRVLDCATGTGDLAIAFKNVVSDKGHVIGTDFNREMLDIAVTKAKHKGLEIEFRIADVLNLPFANDEFDISSIAFGIRNVDDPVEGLKEMARVTQPGGRVVVLEFGQPGGILGAAYRLYSKHIMPPIGALVTGNKKAYEYLPETAAHFPSGAEFIRLMESTLAFNSIRMRSLSRGIAWIYVGVVK